MQTREPHGSVTFLLVDADGSIDCVGLNAGSILDLAGSDMLGLPCHQALGLTYADGRPFCSRMCPVRSKLARGSSRVECHRLERRCGSKVIEICLSAVPLRRPQDGRMAILHIVTQSRHCSAAHQLGSTLVPQRADARTAISFAALTRREREILGLLAEGWTTAEISETLSIAIATVHHHIQHVLEKLEVHRRLDAVLAWSRSRKIDE